MDYFIIRDDGKVHGLAKMINKKTGLTIKITKPIDWNFYLSALTALSSGIALMTVIYYNFSSIFDFSKMGANLVILFTAFMCSGYMWNTIRHPPFLGVGDRGETQVFSGSQQHQFGVEPLIMTVLCKFNLKLISRLFCFFSLWAFVWTCTTYSKPNCSKIYCVYLCSLVLRDLLCNSESF